MKTSPKKRKNKCRGFTLTEAAIVLLLVGTVVSAIWVAGEHVWDSYRITRVNQQMMQTAQNVRDYYGKTIQAWSSAAAKTSAFDLAGLFPVEMRRNAYAAPGTSQIDHALNNSYVGGSVQAYSVANPLTTQLTAFRIELLGLSQAACISLLVGAPLADGTVGIVQIGTQAGTGTTPAFAMQINNGNTNGAITAASISPATAQTWCNNADTNGNNDVDFDFKLRN